MKRTMFAHVRKTGGTTLHRVFKEAVGSAEISPGHGSEKYSTALRRWDALTVISHHLWFAPGEPLSSERINVTILREPIDRCISDYFYVRAQEQAFHANALERRLSLSEYAFSESGYVRALTENHQTKLLAPICLSSNVGQPSEEELLRGAKAALDQFDLVGLTEHLQESVDLISYLTDMEVVEDIPRERATTSRLALQDVPSNIRKKLKDANRLDEELYAYAAMKFRALSRRSFVTLLRLGEKFACDKARVRSPSSGLNNQAPPAKPARLCSLQDPAQASTNRFGTHEIEIERVEITGSISLGAPQFISGEYVNIGVRCRSSVEAHGVTVGLHIHDNEGRLIYGANTWHFGKSISVARGGVFETSFRFKLTLGCGLYQVGCAVHTGNSHLDHCFDWYDNCLTFGVVGVTGFHFDGEINLGPSVELKCEEGEARLTPAEWVHAGVAMLARHNAPIRRPEGHVRSFVRELNVRPGDVFSLELEIENRGEVSWEDDGLRCTRLCYRWLQTDGSVLVEEGERSVLGGDVLPGEKRVVSVVAKTPLQHVGAAKLRMTLLQEHVAWFDQVGKLFCDIPVQISLDHPGSDSLR